MASGDLGLRSDSSIFGDFLRYRAESSGQFLHVGGLYHPKERDQWVRSASSKAWVKGGCEDKSVAEIAMKFGEIWIPSRYLREIPSAIIHAGRGV